MDPIDDSCVFSVTADTLLNAIRSLSRGEKIDDQAAYLLARCGLARDSDLTEAGRALFKLAWVQRKTKEAEQALGQAMRQLNPLQVIEQEMRGLGQVQEEGVLELLKHHRAVANDMTAAQTRPLLRWLSRVGVVAYSDKFKSVRSLAPSPDAALAGEVPAIAAMISPRTPFLNLVKLRRVIRTLRGIVWWADPHFGARALEELAGELNLEAVQEVRIISGDAENVLTQRSLKDFERFQQEMANYGITSQWRVDSRGQRDWHDRWLGNDKSAWNVPPINTLLKNDYSEISPASEQPPFNEWWIRATPRS